MMKRMMMSAVLLLSALGCKPAVLHPPTVQMEVLDDSLAVYAAMWQKEVARRFPDAIVICCHGGEFLDGQWVVKVKHMDLPAMKIEDVVAFYQKKFPDKTCVIIACNVGHLTPHIHGVWYAQDTVFCIPDRATGDNMAEDRFTLDGFEVGHAKQSRWEADPGAVGSIFEFIQSD